jgi:hypothetical protein
VSFADGCADPSLQYPALSGARTADVIHTRPFSSNIGLCTLFLLVQIGSLPQTGDGWIISGEVAGVFGSRTVSFTWPIEFSSGSSTGR